MKNALLATLLALPTLFAFTGCQTPDPRQDPNPQVADEAKRLDEALLTAAMELEAKTRKLAEAQGAWADPATLATLQREVDQAQARYDAIEAEAAGFARRYFQEKNGPLVGAISTLLGGIHPAGQGAALAGGALFLQLGGALASRRGRKHLLKAAKGWTPWKSEDGTPFQPVQAVADVARALGWKHSSPDTEAVAEGRAKVEPAD